MTDNHVLGEPVEVLLEALQRVEWKQRRDGMIGVKLRLEPRLGNPFRRALMRVEAELLLEDADRVGVAIDQERTHAQRGADALVALARRVTDAAGRPR